MPPLLPRVAEGDSSAVRLCIDRYGPLVFGLCRRMCRTQADAEDAAQDVFVELWQNAARFNASIASENTFVTMIARRRLIDRLRRQTRHPADESLETAPPPQHAGSMPMIEARDEAAHIRVTMKRLSSEQQQVLHLAIDQGLSYSEIAQQINLPLGTVKTHARRGLIRLRHLLGAGAGSQDLSTSQDVHTSSPDSPSSAEGTP